MLWTASDIGRELGVPPQTVSTWAIRGSGFPEPAFRTSTGLRLYTEEQAQAIIAERSNHLEARRRRQEERALEAHQLAIALKL